MQSLKYLYRYGMGPSSSHTIGPNNAARKFKTTTREAKSYRVSLYGSLSLTGKGHLTDKAIINAFVPVPCEIIWCDNELSYHPNGIKLEALSGDGQVIKEWTTFSIGGGELRDEGGAASEQPHIYSQKLMGGSFRQIEYAAEMALEHHLGLTCDPILGLVQVPCIERNACMLKKLRNVKVG